MATTQQTPQATMRPALSLRDVTTNGNRLPNRYLLHALEGWGKTSFGAMFPKPLFIQTRGETGLETLIDANRLPPTPHLPEITNWADLRGAIQMLTREAHTYKTLLIDTINGAERLCHEHVCNREFGGDWGEKGFLSFHKGYGVAASEWRSLLTDLDALRAKREMIVFLLCHTKVKNFKNPEGADYDRYQPDVHETTWSLTHKWTDVVLFGNFFAVTETDRQTKRSKGVGGKARVLYCERSAAWDAKNRIGLPEELNLGESPQAAYAAFQTAVKAGRGVNATASTVTTEPTTGEQQ